MGLFKCHELNGTLEMSRTLWDSLNVTNHSVDVAAKRGAGTIDDRSGIWVGYD